MLFHIACVKYISAIKYFLAFNIIFYTLKIRVYVVKFIKLIFQKSAHQTAHQLLLF